MDNKRVLHISKQLSRNDVPMHRYLRLQKEVNKHTDKRFVDKLKSLIDAEAKRISEAFSRLGL